jgi:hypothetical protein
VETWGGVKEEVPDFKDASYKRRLHDYRVRLWRERVGVISAGLTFTLPTTTQSQLEAIRAIGLGGGTDADYLRLMIAEYDQARVVEMLFYLSTVTVRGIDEAVERLEYTWRGKPVTAWSIGYTPGKRGALGVDMRTAVRSGLTWNQFCDLSGPEQSQHVAFWMLEDRLGWLVDNGN